MGEDRDRALTMSIRQYCELTGEGEHAVREDIRQNRIPHVLSGKRPLIRILRIPALQRLGATDRAVDSSHKQ